MNVKTFGARARGEIAFGLQGRHMHRCVRAWRLDALPKPQVRFIWVALPLERSDAMQSFEFRIIRCRRLQLFSTRRSVLSTIPTTVVEISQGEHIRRTERSRAACLKKLVRANAPGLCAATPSRRPVATSRCVETKTARNSLVSAVSMFQVRTVGTLFRLLKSAGRS